MNTDAIREEIEEIKEYGGEIGGGWWISTDEALSLVLKHRREGAEETCRKASKVIRSFEKSYDITRKVGCDLEGAIHDAARIAASEEGKPEGA